MINAYSSNEFENQKGSIKIRLERNVIAKRNVISRTTNYRLSIERNDLKLFYETAIYICCTIIVKIEEKLIWELVVCILLHIFVNHAYSTNALRKKIQKFTKDRKLNSGNIYK